MFYSTSVSLSYSQSSIPFTLSALCCRPSTLVPNSLFLWVCFFYVVVTSLFCFFRFMYKWYLEKAMAPHSSTLAWKILWTEEPGGLQSMGLLRVGTTEWLHFHFSLSCIGEGHGNPLQCSCLENPRDGGAWWAAVYGVAQSPTRLKQLSNSSCIGSIVKTSL